MEQHLAARETQADVGNAISTPSKISGDPKKVLTANFFRLQEGLRSLEEFGKIIDPALGTAIEHFVIGLIRSSGRSTDRAGDGTTGGGPAVRVAGRAIVGRGIPANGCVADRGGRGCHPASRQTAGRPGTDRPCPAVAAVDRGRSTLLIINDRPDLAVLAQADGVHVGQEELSVKDRDR